MRADIDIKADVECELQWEPCVDDKGIGVLVDHGVVTLTGNVSAGSVRVAAENVAKHISGVRAIANEITVLVAVQGSRMDTELAALAANVLRWNVATIAADIKPIVRDGVITLTGEVSWAFQKELAEYAVRHLKGVVAVTNLLAVTR